MNINKQYGLHSPGPGLGMEKWRLSTMSYLGLGPPGVTLLAWIGASSSHYTVGEKLRQRWAGTSESLDPGSMFYSPLENWAKLLRQGSGSSSGP